MDRMTRRHRKLVRKQGLHLTYADERPDWLVALSNLKPGKILKIAFVSLALGGFAAGMFFACGEFDKYQKKLIERFYENQMEPMPAFQNRDNYNGR